MSQDDKSRLEADVAAAEAEVNRLRAEHAALAEDLRAEPDDDKHEQQRRAASSLSSARDRLDAARAARAVLEKTGSPYGLVAEDGRVTGAVAVVIKPGSSREAREAAIEAELDVRLAEAAQELGVVLAASPARYTRERPGRDAEGRTVLEVAGRVEGDRLVPAVSRAAKTLRRR